MYIIGSYKSQFVYIYYVYVSVYNLQMINMEDMLIIIKQKI